MHLKCINLSRVQTCLPFFFFPYHPEHRCFQLFYVDNQPKDSNMSMNVKRLVFLIMHKLNHFCLPSKAADQWAHNFFYCNDSPLLAVSISLFFFLFGFFAHQLFLHNTRKRVLSIICLSFLTLCYLLNKK